MRVDVGVEDATQDLVGIALTGYGMMEDMQRSREAGFRTHLTKPVSVAALDKALSMLLHAGLRRTQLSDCLSRRTQSARRTDVGQRACARSDLGTRCPRRGFVIME